MQRLTLDSALSLSSFLSHLCLQVQLTLLTTFRNHFAKEEEREQTLEFRHEWKPCTYT